MSFESLLRTEAILEGCETDHERYRCCFAEETSRKFLTLYRTLHCKFLIFFPMLSLPSRQGLEISHLLTRASIELDIFYELPVYRLTKELSLYTSSITFATVIKAEVNLKDT